MTRLLLLLFILVVVTSGCATANKLNNVSLGMSKQEVISELGPPVSTSAKEGVEYLKYFFVEKDVRDGKTPYYVRLVNGKVESYGRVGDFDSTKTPETKSTIDLNINK